MRLKFKQRLYFCNGKLISTRHSGIGQTNVVANISNFKPFVSIRQQ